MVLKPSRQDDIEIKGIVFDMDGTLTEPQTYMFKEMREALGILGKPVDILDYIASLPEDEAKIAEEKVQSIENNTMLKMTPRPGLQTLFKYLSEAKIKHTICTRNTITPVNYLLDHYLDAATLTEPVVTRSFTPPKPSPKPLLYIADSWGVAPENLIMVGDSRDDMYSGLGAGCSMIFMHHKDNDKVIEEIPEIDHVIEDFYELDKLLASGYERKPKEARSAAHTSGY